MMLIEETTVPDGALPVDDFKAHLRVGSGFTTDSLQDEVLRSFLRAALAAIEARTGKALYERQFSYGVTAWRDAEAQVLPVAPVRVVTGLKSIDSDGVEMALDAGSIWLEQDPARPRLRSVGSCLPTIPQAGSVSITFWAGFGPLWSDIPADLRQAVFLLASHYYEYRNETALSEGCMPFGVSSLIERYRVFRVFGGGAR